MIEEDRRAALSHAVDMQFIPPCIDQLSGWWEALGVECTSHELVYCSNDDQSDNEQDQSENSPHRPYQEARLRLFLKRSAGHFTPPHMRALLKSKQLFLIVQE